MKKVYQPRLEQVNYKGEVYNVWQDWGVYDTESEAREAAKNIQAYVDKGTWDKDLRDGDSYSVCIEIIDEEKWNILEIIELQGDRLMNNDFQKECDERVKGIAEELEQYCEGFDDQISELQDEIWELEEAEPEEPDQEDDESDEDYDKRYKAWEKKYEKWEAKRDAKEKEKEDLENKGDLQSYFDDCLDIQYIVNGNKDYESVRVWVTVGGPSIYVDTEEGAVILNWGGTHSEYYISGELRDAIDEIFSDLYSCC